MNSRKEVEAFVKLVQSIVDKKEIGKKRPGVITNIDRETNHMTILLSDGSHQTIEIQTDAPYTIGDSVNIVPDGTVSLMGESSTPIGGNELLSNGDFALGNLKYWDNYQFQNIAITSGEHFTGDYSCGGSVYGPWESYLCQDIITIAVIPGEVYKQTGYFKTDAVDSNVLVWLDAVWFTSDGQEIDVDYQKSEQKSITNEDDWIKLVTYNRAPPEASYVRVKYCVLTADKTVNIYFDNLSFWGKSQSLPSTSIPGLPGLDNIPPCAPIGLDTDVGVEVVVDTYNYYLDLSFEHIDTLIFASGEAGLVWDNTDFDHYEIYYKTSGDDYLYYGQYKPVGYLPSGTVLTFRLNNLYENTAYDLMIKASDYMGNLSSGATLLDITTLYNKAPKHPTILSDKSSFRTENAEVCWEPVTLNFDDTPSGIGGLVSDVKDYKVEIYCSGGLVRTEYVGAPYYLYTLAKNVADNVVPQPSGLFKIYARDFGDLLSSGSEISLINYPPMQPSGLNIDFTTKDCVVSWDIVTKDNQNDTAYDITMYQLEITPSGESAETYYSDNPTFAYSYELNIAKKSNVGVKVRCLDVFGQASSWAQGSGINVAPNKAPTPTSFPAFQRVLVDWESAEELAQTDSTMKDVVRTALAHCNISSGEFAEIATLESNFYVHEVEKDTHNFYKTCFVDIFNQSGEWSDVSSDAFTEKTITIADLAGAAYQLTPTSSYELTSVSGEGINDITRLYNANVTDSVFFGSGEQWIQYEYPVSHVVNKTFVAFPSGDEYSFFLAYKLASGDEWTYLAGDKNNLSAYTSKDEAYGDIITISGESVLLTWTEMAEARYVRFYFPSGAQQWASGNYLTELNFKTYVIADEIDAGTINLAKGISLFNDETGSGFRFNEQGAVFENGYITILGDGCTVIKDGKIYVRASGANERDISEIFANVSNETLIEGGYIRTGSIDAEILRVAGEGYFSNMVENPSLEIVNTSGDFAKAWTPSGAGIYYHDNSDFAKFARHYIEASGASRCCESEFIQVRTEDNVDEDLTFMLSTYLTTQVNGFARVRLAQYDGAETPNFISYITVVDNFGSASQAYSWTRKHAVCNIDESCYKVKVLLESTASSTASVFFDGIQLEDGNKLTDFKSTYKLGSIIIDTNGIVVDHPDGARTMIDADGIRVDRGRIYVGTEYGQIDLINQIKIGDNLLYNPSFDLFKYDGSQLILEGWDYRYSGNYITWGIESVYPCLEGTVGGKFLTVATSGSSVDDFIEFASVKIPINALTPLAFSCYYFIPSGEDAVTVTTKIYRSTNLESPIISGYNFSGDMLINSEDYTLAACSDNQWAIKETEGLINSSDGYVYVLLGIKAVGACDAQPVKLGALQLEVGDVCTKYDDKLTDFLSNKFSWHKLGVTKSLCDKYIIEGIVGSIE